MSHDRAAVRTALGALRGFMSHQQIHALAMGSRGEEGDWFAAKAIEMANLCQTMPKTYQQDGKGDDAVVHLHYFHGGMDWYITERDMEEEQLQAFGLADLGYGGELGYIPITELIANGVELDLHWTPKTLRALKPATVESYLDDVAFNTCIAALDGVDLNLGAQS